MISKMCVSQYESSSHGWDLPVYRNLHESESESFANLSIVLDHVRLNDELEDIRIWKPDIFGGFSCKSVLVALQNDDGTQVFEFYKFVWKSGIQTRIKFFA